MKYIKQNIDIVIALVLSLGFVFLLNLNTFSQLTKTTYDFDSETEIDFSKLSEGDVLHFSATPNQVFKLKVDGAYIYSTIEFGENFLVLSKDTPVGFHEFVCENISYKGQNILEKSIEKLNSPASFEELDIEIEGTSGNFSDKTKLFECSFTSDQQEINRYLIIAVEFLGSLVGILLILKQFRKPSL